MKYIRQFIVSDSSVIIHVKHSEHFAQFLVVVVVTVFVVVTVVVAASLVSHE